MTQRLTPASAKALEAGRTLRDHEVAGLELRARKTCKTWNLYYRTRTKIERRKKLGTYPEMTLSRARSVALELKDRISLGEDPAADWKTASGIPTVAEVCDRYIEEWLTRKNAANTIKTHTQIIEAQIKPGLGSKRLTEVTRQDIDLFLGRVYNREFMSEAERERAGDTAHWTALSARDILSKLYKLSIEYFEIEGVVKNPVKHTTTFTRRKRKRHVTMTEWPKIALELSRLSETDEASAAYIWTLFLTGGRVSEILNARAEWLIDKGNGARVLRLEKHKTVKIIGPKEITLPVAAWDVIERYGKVRGPLFGDVSYTQLIRAWHKVRKAAGCPDLKLLDTRRSFASMGLSIGLTLDQIAEQLGHTGSRITKDYAWLMIEKRTDQANKVADAMRAAANGPTSPPSGGATGA